MAKEPLAGPQWLAAKEQSSGPDGPVRDECGHAWTATGMVECQFEEVSCQRKWISRQTGGTEGRLSMVNSTGGSEISDRDQ